MDEQAATSTPTPTSSGNNNLMLISIGVIILVLAGVGFFMFVNQSNPQSVTQNQQSQSPTVATEQPTTPQSISPTEAAAMQQEATTKTFSVSGKNFSFTPSEIRVKQGDSVVINFSSASGFHDFVINELNVRTQQLNTGGNASVTFVASKKGTFEYYCSVGNHRQMGMVGKLIVE